MNTELTCSRGQWASSAWHLPLVFTWALYQKAGWASLACPATARMCPSRPEAAGRGPFGRIGKPDREPLVPFAIAV